MAYRASRRQLLLGLLRCTKATGGTHRQCVRPCQFVKTVELEIHPTTAGSLDIHDGEWVIVETVAGQVKLKAKYNAFLHPPVVATQHGWWQGCQELGLPGYDPFGPDGANANLLIPHEVLDPISGSVPHRSQRCCVRKESGLA
jgi:anaerobic selenocysteine-containing dehydrogenase